jgi:hypothetical protein
VYSIGNASKSLKKNIVLADKEWELLPEIMFLCIFLCYHKEIIVWETRKNINWQQLNQ